MAINRDKVEAAAIKLLQQGKYDKAIIELKKLVDDDKTDVRTLLKLGDTHVKLGAKKESIESYEKAAAIYTEQGFYLKAVAVFKQILRVDANIPELHLKLAELYQQLGLTSDALQHYQNVAVFHEQQGRPREALDMLKRMVDLDPDNIASRIKLGELFAQQGLAAEAVQELRSALGFLKQQQRFDDYVRVGEKLVAYDTGALDVARELATIYMQRQQPDVALGKLQMCFKADPRNVEILSMIASAFQEMQQGPKTVQVLKEMARIYAADGKADLAAQTWERVLTIVPGDAEAEHNLGRRGTHSPQATTSGGRPILVPTVVATGQAAAPLQQPAMSNAQQRHNVEDEQLQRLLTETDVYVKYGLRDKAIDHLQKVFALRADHIPALEKQKILQLATQAPQREIVETLKKLVRAAEAQGHSRVDEWRAELSRTETARAQPPRPTTAPSIIIPVSQRDISASGEGDIVITDEPSQSALPQDPVDDDSGLIELEPRNSQEGAPVGFGDDFGAGDGSLLSELPPDEPEDIEPLPPRPHSAPVASSRSEIPRMPTGVMNAVGAPTPLKSSPLHAPAPMKAPQPIAPPAQRTSLSAQLVGMQEPLQLDDAVDLNDADALVRKALQDISAEDVAAALDGGADSLLLEASDQDILGPPSTEGSAVGPAEGPDLIDDDPFNAPTGSGAGSRSPLTAAISSAPGDAHASGFGDDDDIDRLAREAVADANASLNADAASVTLTGLSDAFSDQELNELQAFATHGNNGAGASSDDEGFNEPTAAATPSRSSDVATDEKPRRQPQPPPKQNDFNDVDEDAPTLFMQAHRPEPAHPSAQAKSVATTTTGPNPLATATSPSSRVPTLAPPAAAGFDNELEDEFDPSSFDLPPDVKELLRKGADVDDFAADPMAGETLGETLGELELELQPSSSTTLGTGQAAPFAEMNSDMLSESSGEVTLRGKLGLEAKAQGFEDDPANQFFPDELEESEFFIQQELLDEAKEILQAILDDVPDSARVQWMLARVAAKEAGEPEPPAPWEQRILEEVQAQLDDLGMGDETLQRPALEHGLGDGSGPQISVEEVLSAFKKGVAETVPEDDAATHYELGIAYREMELRDDAINEFQIAGRAASRAVDARFMIGNVKKEQGKLDEAVAVLDEALLLPQASREQRGAAEYERGVCLEELSRPKDALLAFKNAKANGSAAPDLERRIAALIAKHGDSNGGNGGNGGNGANGHGKPGDKPPVPGTPGGRGPKNIDYL